MGVRGRSNGVRQPRIRQGDAAAPQWGPAGSRRRAETQADILPANSVRVLGGTAASRAGGNAGGAAGSAATGAVLIVGGSRGIGLELARLYASSHAQVPQTDHARRQGEYTLEQHASSSMIVA